MMIGAVDVGGTKIAVGLLDEQGHILEREACPSKPVKSFEDGMTQICAMLETCLNWQGGVRLDGIGIGCTGPVDPISGVLGTNNFFDSWEGHSISSWLEGQFGVSVATENDADAAVLGETRWGAGKNASSCLYITVSTGIGGGLVNGGRLYRGVDDAHPELGHHIIDPSGPDCFCGARGCWESLASGPALAAWYNIRKGSGADADAREVCQMAAAGDPMAVEAVSREGYYLGLGLANMVSLFTPELIILGGGVMESWPLFEESVKLRIRQSCGLVPYEKTRLLRASLGMQTGLLGAEAVWFHRFG